MFKAPRKRAIKAPSARKGPKGNRSFSANFLNFLRVIPVTPPIKEPKNKAKRTSFPKKSPIKAEILTSPPPIQSALIRLGMKINPPPNSKPASGAKGEEETPTKGRKSVSKKIFKKRRERPAARPGKTTLLGIIFFWISI